MPPGVRALHTMREEVLSDPGTPIAAPLVRVAALAVIRNPWVGRWVADLSPEVQSLCPPLARELMDRALLALDGMSAEAFGKAVIVGSAGEIEHGDALVHNPFFSDVVRDRVGGTSVISSTETRAPAGTSISIPLCHVTAATTRSHYQGMSVGIPDSPAADEIVVAVALAAGGRRHARIGDRRTDPAFDASLWRP